MMERNKSGLTHPTARFPGPAYSTTLSLMKIRSTISAGIGSQRSLWGASLGIFLPDRLFLGVDMVAEAAQTILSIITRERVHKGRVHEEFFFVAITRPAESLFLLPLLTSFSVWLVM